MAKRQRPGLLWSSGIFNTTPKWATEPSISAIEAVCRRHLRIEKTANCNVEFRAAGAYNKAYTVTLDDGRRFLMRISLPVDPKNKTRGEVATLRIARFATTIPVPEVIAFNDSSENEIGYEWILMELMPGKPVYYRWRKMSAAQKLALVGQVADFQSQLFYCAPEDDDFRRIGTPGTAGEINGDLKLDKVKPGPLVSQLFFIGNHYDYDVPRGPFRGSYEWIRASLDIIIKAQEADISNAENEDDKEDAVRDLQVTRQLEDLLPVLLPPNDDPCHTDERTVLWHDDLSLHNILVDSDGKITAVVDWECVSTFPLWVAGQPPKFLSESTREIKPERHSYAMKTDFDDGGGNGEVDELDDEGMDSLYWIHLMEYEQTQLRKVYAAHMRLLWPEWDTTQQGYLKVDFLDAATCIASGWVHKRIPDWVNAIKRGEKVRLMEVLEPA